MSVMDNRHGSGSGQGVGTGLGVLQGALEGGMACACTVHGGGSRTAHCIGCIDTAAVAGSWK